MAFSKTPAATILLTCLLGSLFCGDAANGSTGTDPVVHARPDTAAIMARTRILTNPMLAGRGSGSSEAAAAADTIAGWLAAIGLVPAHTGEWYQQFPLQGESRGGLHSRNVTGLLPGRGALADRYVVVGAHYDHLGRVAGASDDGTPGAGEYYPGANDNASGVTLLVELARLLSFAAVGDDRRSCLFVAFGAEEIGLQGSARFVQEPPVPLEAIDAMINFDSVGQLKEDLLYVGGVGTTAAFERMLVQANEDELTLSLSSGGWAGSDHVSFNLVSIPVLFLFTGPYPQYNRPEDDWPTLDFDGLAKVTAFAHRLLVQLLHHAEPLPFVAVTTADLRAPDGDAPARRAWLGTIPDFTAQDSTGVRLGGVMDGSPAQRAGLAKGDLLVKLADRRVRDLAALAEILRSCQPGQQVNLEVIREGQALAYIVILADRERRP